MKHVQLTYDVEVEHSVESHLGRTYIPHHALGLPLDRDLKN